MIKATKPPRRSSGVFILGRDSFSKISAVEGIRLSMAAVETFGDFDRKRLSPKARRDVLIAQFSINR